MLYCSAVSLLLLLLTVAKSVALPLYRLCFLLLLLALLLNSSVLLLLLLLPILFPYYITEFSVAAVSVALPLLFSFCRCCSCHNGIIVANALQRRSHLCIPFWELRGLRPYFHIHVSAIYIFPGSVHIFFLQQNRQSNRGNI